MNHKDIRVRNRSIKRFINESLRLRGRWIVLLSLRGRHLIVGAALLHIALAVALFGAGRAQIAPGLLDRDGIMDSFAYDSYQYRLEALQQTGLLGSPYIALVLPSFETEAVMSDRIHVKVFSLEFRLLGPLFGYGILSAEPFNLFCYLAILSLVIMIGREMGSRRVGMLAAGIVALWPTFLLHTTQFLKDPLFIAAALALILIVLTWLTRTYSWQGAALFGVTLIAVAGLLMLVRLKFAGFIFAMVFLGFICLIVRQLIERRLLYWNMLCPMLILLVAVPAAFYTTASNQKFKKYPSDQSGLRKSDTATEKQMLGLIFYRGRATLRMKTSPTYAEKLSGMAELIALKIDAARNSFSFYQDSGSSIDRDIEFNSFKDLILYLPRSLAIGLWAPFPDTWAGAGKRVGSAGRLLSGAETLIIYLCELLALAALWREPRALSNWLLSLIFVFGVAALGLTISNLGALYRLRYFFWILLIILGAKGVKSLLAMWRERSVVPPQTQPLDILSQSGAGTQRMRRRLTSAAMLMCIVICCATISCVSRNASTGYAESPSPQSPTDAPGVAAGGLDFTISNFINIPIYAIYLSPHDSAGWEENILGKELLADGGTVKLRFRPEEQNVMWDLRVMDAGGSKVEWKNLDLREISAIMLRANRSNRDSVRAEIE